MKEKEFDLRNYEDYKYYYEDSTKEEIVNETYADYLAYRNLIDKNKQLEDKLNKIQEIFKKYHYDTVWAREIADLQLDEYCCLVEIFKEIER